MAASVYGIHANVCLSRSSPPTHLRPVVANTNTQSASTRLTSTHTHHLDHVCDISLAMDMLTRFSVAHVPQNQHNALCCTPVPFVVRTLTFHSLALLPFTAPSSTPGPCLSCCRNLQPPAHFRHTSKQGKHNGCRSDRSMGLEQAEGFCRGWAQGSSHTGVSWCWCWHSSKRSLVPLPGHIRCVCLPCGLLLCCRWPFKGIKDPVTQE